MKRPHLALFFASLLAVAGFLVFSAQRGSTLVITSPVAVPVAGQPGAFDVYFSLENRGAADVLTGVTSPRGQVSVIGRPEGVTRSAIPAGATPGFSSDGVFLRLSGVTGDTGEGTLVPLRLDFAQAGRVAFKARVTGDGGLATAHDVTRAAPVGAGAVPQVTLSAQLQPEGAGWDLALVTRNFTFLELCDDPDLPGVGHVHLYLDGLKLGRMFLPVGAIGALPEGSYQLKVALTSNNHLPFGADGQPSSDTITLVAN